MLIQKKKRIILVFRAFLMIKNLSEISVRTWTLSSCSEINIRDLHGGAYDAAKEQIRRLVKERQARGVSPTIWRVAENLETTWHLTAPSELYLFVIKAPAVGIIFIERLPTLLWSCTLYYRVKNCIRCGLNGILNGKSSCEESKRPLKKNNNNNIWLSIHTQCN